MERSVDEKNVGWRSFKVSALHKHAFRPERRDPLRGAFRARDVAHFDPRESLRLVRVGCDQRRMRQETLFEDCDRVVRQEARPVFANHHGVDHKVWQSRGNARDAIDDGSIAERPCLHCLGRDVVEHCDGLREDEIGIERHHAVDVRRVLDREQRHHRFAVDAVLVKRLEIGLQTGASGRIRTGNRERNRNHGIMVHRMRSRARHVAAVVLVALFASGCGTHDAESAEQPARAAAPVPAPPAPTVPDAGAATVEHTVTDGETLWDIAQAYGLRSRDIMRENHLDARDVRRLAPGTVLRIPGATTAADVATAADRTAIRELERASLPPLTDGTYYTLVQGDTLSEVAERFNVDADAIIARNELTDDDLTSLRPGRILVLPGVREADVARQATRPRQGVRHTLARGETVWDVASAYQVSVAAIMSANSLDANSVTALREGAALFVPGAHEDRGRPRPHPESRRQASALTLARRLHLGTRSAAGDLLYGRVRPEWIRAANQTRRGRRNDDLPGTLRWPVAGGWFVRGYGSGEGHYHQALDIAGNMGWNVRAAAGGIVGYAGNEVSGYGNMVMVIHPGGWVTMYAHNSVLYVVAGQRVEAGAVLAELGSTGISRGPHVHFELSYRGQMCDPAVLMRPGIRHRNGRIEPLRYASWTDASERPRGIECDGRRRHPHSRHVLDETPEADSP